MQQQEYAAVYPGHYVNPRPLPPVAPPPAQGGRTLGVVSLVIASLSLLCTVAMGALLAIGIGMSSWSMEPLSGQVSEVSRGSVAGATLSDDVSAVIGDSGGDVGEMSCPAASRVTPGTTVVCRALVDDVDWTVFVLFEDRQGRFALNAV